MIIGFDMDGVFADFNTAFIRRCVAVTGRNLYPAGYVPHTWNYPESLGYTAEEVSAVWDAIKADRAFWGTLSAYPDVIGVLSSLWVLDCFHDLYFVTNRMGSYPKAQTEQWLRNYGLKNPTVLLSAKKGAAAYALSLDAYIDDKWENALDVANSEGFTRSFLLTRPWNIQYDEKSYGITRVSSVSEFLDAL